MQQIQILIVEQEEHTIQLLNELLGQRYQLLFVALGERAIKIVEQNKIDLMIISRYLPDMDGLELLRTARENLIDLPIIFLADSPTKEFILSVFRAGANDFFEKPVRESEILDCINKFELSLNTHIAYPKKPANFLKNKSSSFSREHAVKGFFKRIVRNITSDKSTAKICFSDKRCDDCNHANPTVDSNNSNPYQEKNGPTTLKLNFFGKFQVSLNGGSVAVFQGRKAKELFSYLAYYHKRKISREFLMDKFWQKSSPDAARNCLNVTLHSIRNTFQQVDDSIEIVQFKDESYFINPDLEVISDVEEFKQHWQLAKSIEREQRIEASLNQYEIASALYRGDFLEDLLYAGWTDLERENLKEIYLFILNKLSYYYSMDGKPDVAINLCNTILEKDNCREDVHRRLMRCYYRTGRRIKALRQYHKCTEILDLELEVEPTKSTTQLYEKIKQECLKPESKDKDIEQK